MNEVETLNSEIRDAEWNRDIGYLEKLLDDDLIFRRANGSLATKENYLAGLRDMNNVYEILENSSVNVQMNETSDRAVAIVTVKASGTRGPEKKPFGGQFKNIRFFRKGKDWKLFAWYNETLI